MTYDQLDRQVQALAGADMQRSALTRDASSWPRSKAKLRNRRARQRRERAQ